MNKKGFTLIEIVVAMAVASVVLAAIFTMFHAQTQSHRQQQLTVQMQQNLRAVVHLLEREIRMAGYSAAEHRAAAGFRLNFGDLAGSEASGATINATNIAFTTDSGPGAFNDNGQIDTGSSFEVVAFRYDAADRRIERWDVASGQWQVAAEQISGLTFTYYNGANPPAILPLPMTVANLANIRSVQVAISAIAGDRTMNLTHTIKCRNAGL